MLRQGATLRMRSVVSVMTWHKLPSPSDSQTSLCPLSIDGTQYQALVYYRHLRAILLTNFQSTVVYKVTNA